MRPKKSDRILSNTLSLIGSIERESFKISKGELRMLMEMKANMIARNRVWPVEISFVECLVQKILSNDYSDLANPYHKVRYKPWLLFYKAPKGYNKRRNKPKVPDNAKENNDVGQ